jgi:hypothetical protein
MLIRRDGSVGRAAASYSDEKAASRGFKSRPGLTFSAHFIVLS